jgi:hypothetical protein
MARAEQFTTTHGTSAPRWRFGDSDYSWNFTLPLRDHALKDGGEIVGSGLDLIVCNIPVTTAT